MIIFIGTRFDLLDNALRLHLQPDFDMSLTTFSSLASLHFLLRFATTLTAECRMLAASK